MNTKKDIRSAMQKTVLLNLTPDLRQNAAVRASSFLLTMDEYKKADVVFSYMALPLEADTSLINTRAIKDGKQLLLPKICGARVMQFCAVDPAIPLALQTTKNRFGINEPSLNNIFSLDSIAPGTRFFVLVPGIAFTKDGRRLGRGFAYYDRYLTRFKKALYDKTQNNSLYTAGYCFSFQLLESIPVDEHDVRVDFVLHEQIA